MPYLSELTTSRAKCAFELVDKAHSSKKSFRRQIALLLYQSVMLPVVQDPETLLVYSLLFIMSYPILEVQYSLVPHTSYG